MILLKFSYRCTVVDIVRHIIVVGLILEVAASGHILLQARTEFPKLLLVHLHLLNEATLRMIYVRKWHGRDAEALVQEGILLLKGDLDELDTMIGEIVDQFVELWLGGTAAAAPFGVESNDGDAFRLVGHDGLVVLEGFDVEDQVPG